LSLVGDIRYGKIRGYCSVVVVVSTDFSQTSVKNAQCQEIGIVFPDNILTGRIVAALLDTDSFQRQTLVLFCELYFALVGCTVFPDFDSRDYEMAGW
jgi:hypothetical protein